VEHQSEKGKVDGTSLREVQHPGPVSLQNSRFGIFCIFLLISLAIRFSFANGKSTALVLDSGATHTSAIPVYDGYCVTQAIIRSPLGGDAITTWCKQFLDEQGVEVVPSYMIHSKETVGERDKAVWTRKPNLPEVTKSYHDAMTKV